MPTLREVMSADLTVVSPAATVAEAAQLMSVRHVGSVLVMDADDLAGIFTERDIVRALASDFDAPGQEVAMWMTPDPVRMEAHVSTGEALDRMLTEGFRHMPVTQEGRLCGIVSLRDLAPR